MEIEVELRPLNTTGGHQVWKASHVLLARLKEGLLDPRLLQNALEMGSGTGWLGLAICAAFPTARVKCTDQKCEEAQSLLARNVAVNFAHHQGRCRADVLDFFDPLPAEVEPWSVVLGADLVYTRDIAKAFPRVVSELLRSQDGLVMVYAHTFRRYDFVDNLMLEQFAALGLCVREMVGRDELVDVAPVPESGEQFEDFELFPEQVLKVLHISLLT